MIIAFIVLSFFFGASLASFFANLSYRLEKGEEILKSRSRCENCRHDLGVRDLFPVFGYLFARGKCNYCKTSIPIKYLFYEIGFGIGTAIIYLRVFEILNTGSFSPIVSLMYYAFTTFVLSLMIFVSIYDIDHQLILESTMHIGIVGVLIFYAFLTPLNLLWLIGVGILNGLLIWLIVFITKEKAMGKGDIKLGVLIGLIAGWPGAQIALFLAFVTGSLVGLALLFAGIIKRRQPIPFGPFLALGGMIAFLWGAEILDWYINLVIL